MDYKAFKIRLELNNKEKTLCNKHAGVARHAYNWGVKLYLDLLEENYELFKEEKEQIKYPSGIDLHKELVATVKQENEWYYEVSKYSPQQALRDLHSSLNNYFRKLKSGEIGKLKQDYIKKKQKAGTEINYNHLNNIGKPKFKKKGINDSFYLEGPRIVIEGNKIKLPNFGWVKMSETKHIPEKIKNVVISRRADEWFISFKIEIDENQYKIDNNKKQGPVGVDLGIKTLATLSNGMVFKGSKPFRKFKRKLKIEQRKLSKKFKKGEKEQSNNYKKQRLVVAKLHAKISDIRKDDIHKLTTYLAKNHSEIIIEDLNVKGMSKNHKLASAILDGGFFEFRRQLEYKCKKFGSILTVVDRWFPSSKTCSCCGNIKKDLKLSDRVYVCECGFTADRDLNASYNLEKKAVSFTASACGELYQSNDLIKGSSVKQESNLNLHRNVWICVSLLKRYRTFDLLQHV